MRLIDRRTTVASLTALVLVGSLLAGRAAAAPEGTLAWGLHVTLASRWLDPIDTEAFINQFMVLYSSGVVPEIEDLFARQARELDRAKREAMLHQIQPVMHDRVMHVPIYELAFLWGVGRRVEEACVDHIKGFSYSAPYEDLKIKPGAKSWD